MSVVTRTTSPSTEAKRDAAAKLAALRNAAAVRERCRLVCEWVRAGRSPHFTLDETRMADVAAYVADVTRAAYPDLNIPPHSRWRHFSAGGIDRWARLSRRLVDVPKRERARIAIDLATVSVLLDAGAGERWRYREQSSGLEFARSEGLAVASLDMFVAGLFSSQPDRPLQVDAAALKSINAAILTRAFHADAQNPLIGLDQRVALLNRLGHALEAHLEEFGPAQRPGHLVDHLAQRCRDGRIPAPFVLTTLLDALSSIWPSGLVIDGFNLGDVGYHPAVRTSDVTNRVVPFHKLSQWLTYSLIEPIGMDGLSVVDIDGLTALPEYRNGGLLIDLGVICPRRPLSEPQLVASELVVEWRALTVALMDDLLGLVRARLGLDASFRLPQLLQGGTWTAGRKIALERRPPQGNPPIPLIIDGSVF